MSWFGRLAAKRARRPLRAQLGLECLETRLTPALSGDAWNFPKLMTISFVPDGTVIGPNRETSNLFATFNAKFGSTSAWQNVILKAAQVYAQVTNVNFSVIPDNGTPIGGGNYQQGDPGMGDIRIGGFGFSNNSNIALAYMPPPDNTDSYSGDLQFNTNLTFTTNGQTYDLFSVAAHEIGHALGLAHSTMSTAVMYGYYNGSKPSLTSDDTSSIRSLYSNGLGRTEDSYDSGPTPNTSFAAAANLNFQISQPSLTALVQNLDITTTSEKDYFTFAAPTGTSSSLTLKIQSAGLSMLAPKVTIYAANQTTILGSASGLGQYGTTLSVTINNVFAGEVFYVRVEAADSTSAFGVGAYAMTMNFGSGPSPSVPLPNTQVAAVYSGGIGTGALHTLGDLMSLPGTSSPVAEYLTAAPGFVPQSEAGSITLPPAVNPHLGIAASPDLPGGWVIAGDQQNSIAHPGSVLQVGQLTGSSGFAGIRVLTPAPVNSAAIAPLDQAVWGGASSSDAQAENADYSGTDWQLAVDAVLGLQAAAD
jgi:hypothetical protein